MLEEFKKFALKGNMIDLAVGVIIGGAFTGLVNSVVNDLIMPVVGLLTGGIDFSNKFFQLSGDPQKTLAAAKATGATLAYGNFLSLLINFFIVAWILFMVVKLINMARNKADGSTPKDMLTPSEKLLTEIRDLLSKKAPTSVADDLTK